ncbi:hypothetical protein ACVWYV_001881 [Pantoea eucalypti]
MILHAEQCTLCMYCYPHSGLLEKGLYKGKGPAQKKSLVGQRLYGVNELVGMQNHNGPACDVLSLVPVVAPVPSQKC